MSQIITIKKIKKKGGTLYYASLLINDGSYKDNQIYIINGQNTSQINEWKQRNTLKWNPCIPKRFDEDKSITITFISNSIWYPLNVCNYQNNSMSYQNQYLFDGGKALTINNLNIIDYIIDDNTNYPILNSRFDDAITLNHGLIINISSSIQIHYF